METYRILLVGITAALGFVALGLGGFLLDPPAYSLRRSPRRERMRTPSARVE